MSEPGGGLSPLKRALVAVQDLTAKLEAARRARQEPIAVVGISCRFPGGAHDPESFWRLLQEGRHAVREIPADRWDVEAFYDPNADAPGKMYTRSGGFLDTPVDRFDARFFEIAPREVIGMDPQQRLLLELAWESLEHAGLAPERLAGTRTGVFVGISATDFSTRQLRQGEQGQPDAYSATGNAFSVAAGRISYLLGLQGPNLALDTACSSSLVAVALAVQSLRDGRADQALAGGVNLMLTPETFIGMCKLRALAADGRCKSFDAAADGYVRGEGGGIVVLKRLSDALAAGDRIHAVIRGVAVNHDGRSSGLTVPNAAAQQAVIREALADAGLTPERVDYVEAHGTGTALGDPIELRALDAVLGRGRPHSQPLTVGSVKTNFGHLEAAAGIAGLIKLIISLSHEAIPPHLHLEQPTPHVEWDELGLAIPTALTAWPRGERPRVAGVSSFGFSGTNAHLLVEEAPLPQRTSAGVERPLHLLPLSARTPEALRELARRYDDHLARATEPLGDICFTAATGRNHFEQRVAVVGRTADEIRGQLREYAAGAADPTLRVGEALAPAPPKIAFLFPGQGAQYVNMGRRLYETEPRFRQTLERCQEILRPHLDPPLLPVLYPAPGEEAEAQALLDQTLYTQPALFAIEYALCELWRSWGVEPHALLGHSVGEYVAACIAGVFSLEEGLGLIAERARLMQALPAGGAMAAVFAGEEEVRRAVAPYARQVAIAALNGPENTVISGEGMAVQRVLEALAARGIHSRALQVSHAFHSPLVDPVRAPFATAAASTRFAPPRMALISNLTGRPAGAEIATPEYWTEQLTAPVTFAASMHSLRESGCQLFLEVGPGSTLVAMGQRYVGDGLWLASVRSGRDDWAQILDSLAALYTSGAVPDWEGFHRDHSRQKVVLPTYPFQRTRYWPAERSTRPAPASQEDAPDPLEIGDWLYRPTWRPAARMGEADSPGTTLPGHWLILADDAGEGVALAAALEASGDRCTIARPAGQPAGGSGVTRSFDPADPAALQSLISEAMTAEAPLRGVVHLWSLDSARADVLELAAVERALTLGGVAVRHLVQALAAAKLDPSAEAPRLWLVTRGGQMVGEEPMQAAGVAQAPLWGMGKTIALEHPELWGGVIDLDPAAHGDDTARIVAELRHPDGEKEIAFRGRERHVARVLPAGPAVASAHPYRPRPDGAYLITGGLGGLGLQVARWLAEQGARRLILLSRTPLPPRAAWKQVTDAPPASQIAAIRQLEAMGTSVHPAAVDVADEAQLSGFLASYEEEGWPSIRGVVHAAGVTHDRTLLQMDSAALEAALRPKAHGGWLLHRLLQNAPLDFFVLFSSAASLTGSAGQANYAAANAFLDALALHRRGKGLPALSINWGPWAEVGMAARADLAERRARTGMGTILPRQGVELLGRLLRQDAPQVGVVPLAPAGLRQAFPADTPWLSELPLEASAGAADDDGERAIRDDILAAPTGDRAGLLLDHLRRRIARIIVTDPTAISPERSVMQLGMDSLMVVELIRALNRDLQLTLYPGEIFESPSIEALAEYLLAEVKRATGGVMIPRGGNGSAAPAEIEEGAAVRPRLPSRPLVLPEQRNPRAVFLLSSPRSGSTLLRVMLAGHPELFCPPELHLLPFDRLGAWNARLDRSYLGEGLQRAVMELMKLDAEQSKALLDEWVAQDLPIHQVYRRLQTLAGQRILVDKSPSYAAELATLERAELIFEEPRYIHLVRHPLAVIDSFVRNRMEKLFAAPDVDPAGVAEQVWTEANSNTIDFLRELDPARHHRVRYEELVTDPERVMRELCAFLGVSFVPELLAPYQGNRMADGVHAGSLPIGDPNFHDHDSIDPALAEAWRRVKLARRLGGAARRLAQEIGYEVEVPNAAAASATVRDSRAPLSFSQQRLYFLEQLEPGAATYILPAVLRVKGTLELEALERSVRGILERHEVLRTMLVTQDGHPFQEVLALDEFALPIENLEEVPEETREEAVRQRVSELLHRPFELDRDLKLRAHLLRLEEREHLLVVAMHHIASDGSSVEIFLRELTALYEAFAAGNPSPLPALPFQYADFAERQRQQLQGTLLENQLAYWREQLADLPVLDLPTDRPRPPVQTHRGNSRSWVASAPLIDRLKRLSQQENVTLYMTLLAAFKLLLSRLSGQEEVVVGSPIAGRNQEGTERLIGFFLNNLVLRTDLSGDPSFSELLARVRETTLAAYANQEIPFEKLLEELKPPRDLSRTPLFQVMFNMVPGGGSERRRLGDAEVELVVGAEESKFDLTLYVADGEDTRFRLVYNPDLFDATSAERLLEHYRTLLEAIAAAPERRLSTLPMVREQRPPRLLPEGISPHSSFIEFPVQALDRSIAARFAEQVRARPDAVAVETDQHVWSYAELERRANQVAHALLRACGSGDDRIALLVEHDAPMLAAVLGVLKAGKSYVPLDPSFPAERLQRILEDAGPSALLAQASLAAAARRCAGELRVITIEEAWRTEPHQEPELEISPETAAYILYTSGSTGEPKGVVQSQRNVLHHIRTYTNRLRISSGDRLTLLSSYGFDAAVMDIFAALLNGATLCPIDLKSGTDGDLLAEVVRRGITIYHSTPTVYRHMAAQLAGVADLSRVRLVVLGGEEALPRDLEIFRSHFAPHARCVNGLGPTECTVALQYVVDHQGELPRRTIPVGYAVEGTEVVLLNEAGEPVEVYATGEITIRSAHLALGYWRRPELTRTAFLPDPQGGERRLYRTGDLGRLLPDGSIEFVGRRDAQVKIRGYRIETAEIESAMLVHRAVDQAVVLPRRHENGAEGERQLAAYLVVPEGIAKPSQAELRELLRAKLPLYMVPSEYFFLGSLPLTANGKVDRRALLALEQPQPAAATKVAAPEAPLELLIAGIWRDLLEVEQIAVDDNFYDLGGHSLLALRFIARFQDATGIRINPRELTYQTLGQLAAAHGGVAVQLPAGRAGLASKLRRRLQWTGFGSGRS